MAEWSEQVLSALAGGGSSLALALLGALLGFVHALLPGHGKAMLSARHAAGARGTVAAASAMLDGMLVAGSRTLVSAALVIATLWLGAVFGRAPSPATLQAVAGLVLVAIALRMALQAAPADGQGRGPAHARETVREDGAAREGEASGARAGRSLTLPLVVLSLTPEPLSLSLAALALGGRPGVGAGLVGFAVGLGLALGLAGMAGAVAAGRVRGWLGRRSAVTSRIHAALVGLAGVAILLNALVR